jgi:MerR family transcriptional regulator/heat shock protein HspR
MATDYQSPDHPCYVISIVSEVLDLHPQTLRYYERIGLVVPARSAGNVRLYSQRDIERLQRISRLTSELGVNLAGAEVILRLTETIEQLQTEMDEVRALFEAEVQQLRQHLSENGITVEQAAGATARKTNISEKEVK